MTSSMSMSELKRNFPKKPSIINTTDQKDDDEETIMLCEKTCFGQKGFSFETGFKTYN